MANWTVLGVDRFNIKWANHYLTSSSSELTILRLAQTCLARPLLSTAYRHADKKGFGDNCC